MKKIIPLFLILLLSGCGTVYKPSKNVLMLSSKISTEQAIKIFEKSLRPRGKGFGLCHSLRITFERDTVKPKVDKTGITLTEYKLGEVVKKIGDSEIRKKELYKTKILYSEFGTIFLNTDPRHNVASGYCVHRDEKKLALISINTGFLQQISFYINKKDVDKLVAAIMVLVNKPNIVYPLHI